MNGLANFVYQVATTRHRFKFLLSVGGVIFWYGGVGLMIFISPWVNHQLALDLSIPTPVRLSIGIILLVIGVPMVIWTIVRFFRARGTPIPFVPPPGFIIDGLYRIVRNPMHLGWALVLVGLGVLQQSFALLIIMVPFFIVAHIIYYKFVEEKELEKKFGQAYLDYKKRVGMFLPKFWR
ncbi:MAG: isoprenylcysteine carboxylmethyltransferase family protein [Dehalococcoidales bacterium]|nr:isoprenylcysteine carboxylmethyltransferase family protein [Dehalococcoidales bacterium]